MPIYEYECTQCHQVSDALQKVNDPPPETCPHCGARSTLSRLVSRTSFVLKGGGWYADLYSSGKSKGSEGGDSKPASKTDSSSSEAAAPSAPSTSEGGSSSSGGSSGSGSSGSGPAASAPKVAAAKA